MFRVSGVPLGSRVARSLNTAEISISGPVTKYSQSELIPHGHLLQDFFQLIHYSTTDQISPSIWPSLTSAYYADYLEKQLTVLNKTVSDEAEFIFLFESNMASYTRYPDSMLDTLGKLGGLIAALNIGAFI
jgi:hypothetical protein